MKQETSRVLLALIRYAVKKTPLTDEEKALFSAEMLPELYSVSREQDIVHLVGYALKRNGMLTDGDAEIIKKLDKQHPLAIFRCERLRYDVSEICAALERAEIDYLPLKGTVIRDKYPEGWMRTSCDIDILVRENELERAAELLVKEKGYRREELGSHDLSMFSPEGVHLELHYSLIEDDVIGRSDEPLDHVWSYAAPIENGGHGHVMSDDMFYYYHIAHMAKHFVQGGCGTRPLIDLWVLNNRVEHDGEKRRALLEKGGLLTFAENAEMLSRVWFGEDEHTETTLQMQEYLFDGGVYGNMTNRVAVQHVKSGSKFRYLLSRVWIPYETMRFYYPSIGNRKFLLPFYQVRRWFRLLFCGGAKRSVQEIGFTGSITKESTDMTAEMLKNIGL